MLSNGATGVQDDLPPKPLYVHTEAALTPSSVGVAEAVAPMTAMVLPATSVSGRTPSFFSSTDPFAATLRATLRDFLVVTTAPEVAGRGTSKRPAAMWDRTTRKAAC